MSHFMFHSKIRLTNVFRFLYFLRIFSGVGDLTKLNIPAGDSGGELDPHGADGNGENQFRSISLWFSHCIRGRLIDFCVCV